MNYDQFIEDYLIRRYPNAEFSNVFLQQLYNCYSQRILNVWKVLDELDYLEGKTKKTYSKIEREFKRNPRLAGIWYKHFFDPQFMLKNLVNHITPENFKRYWEDAYAKSEGLEKSEEVFHSVLSYNVTIKAFEERSSYNAMTGEWIIYKPNDGKNYYLMLATHGNDKSIEEAIKFILSI